MPLDHRLYAAYARGEDPYTGAASTTDDQTNEGA